LLIPDSQLANAVSIPNRIKMENRGIECAVPRQVSCFHACIVVLACCRCLWQTGKTSLGKRTVDGSLPLKNVASVFRSFCVILHTLPIVSGLHIPLLWLQPTRSNSSFSTRGSSEKPCDRSTINILFTMIGAGAS
jgi:hypothetical protein